jgi:hypothetical protein
MRHYGLQVGDLVEECAFGQMLRGRVVELVAHDNNRAIIGTDDGERVRVVAEWCTVVPDIGDGEIETVHEQGIEAAQSGRIQENPYPANSRRAEIWDFAFRQQWNRDNH